MGLAVVVACGAKSSSSEGTSGQVLTGVGGGGDAGSTTSMGNGPSSASHAAATGTGSVSGPSSSQASSSSSAASSGSGGATCKDLSPAEPNNAESQAFPLEMKPLTDCDGMHSTTGVIKGANDA